MSWRSTWSATKEVIGEFLNDRPFELAAALSYCTLLSIAPLLVVLLFAVGLIWGKQAASGQLIGQIRGMVGDNASQAIQNILAHASGPGQGLVAMTLGSIAVVLGATSVFGQLQSALNQIWRVQAAAKSNAILGMARSRLTALAIVLLVGVLLIASVVLSAAITTVSHFIGGRFSALSPLLHAGNFIVWLVVLTVLIAMIFKLLPDVRIQWKDVWFGALVTSLLFGVGKFLIGLYLGRAGVGSAYGAAGSLVIFLIWIYYSALILFFGAEITKVHARRTGRVIQPAPYAVRFKQVTEES